MLLFQGHHFENYQQRYLVFTRTVCSRTVIKYALKSGEEMEQEKIA